MKEGSNEKENHANCWRGDENLSAWIRRKRVHSRSTSKLRVAGVYNASKEEAEEEEEEEGEEEEVDILL